MKILGYLGALLLFLAPFQTASAAIFNVTISGQVDFIYTGSAPSLDPTTIPFSVGDPWSVSVQIDDSVPDLFPNSASGIYATGGFAGSIGSYNFSTPFSQAVVVNDGTAFLPSPYDLVTIQYRNDQADNYDVHSFFFNLYNLSATAFSSNALSASLFDLSLYDLSYRQTTAAISFTTQNPFEGYNAQLSFDKMTVTPVVSDVPLPGALVFMLTGVLGFVGARRRFKSGVRLSAN